MNHRARTRQSSVTSLSLGLATILALTVARVASNPRSDKNIREVRKILDHPPRIVHQPQNTLVKANKPHAIECPVDAKPEAEIKWFKDNQLLAGQPAHLEQTGAELMFFSIQEQDAGDYHCQATNYMGSVRSDSFRLEVQSSILDPRLRMEPRLAEVGVDQRVDFTCSIPNQKQSPDVSWRRNGQKLKVKWLDEGEDEQIGDTRFKFVARPLPASEQQLTDPEQSADQLRFVLTITRTSLRDDNSTFSCLYKSDHRQDTSVAADQQQQADELQSDLARESMAATLRVYELSGAEQQPSAGSMQPNPSGPLDQANNNNGNGKQGVKLDINLGPPINDVTGNNPHEIMIHEPTRGNTFGDNQPHNTSQLEPTNNRTTQLVDPTSGVDNSMDVVGSGARSATAAAGALLQKIMNLFELVKPALVLLGLLSVVGILVLLQLMYSRVGRQKLAQNRYIKHHHYLTSSASGSSSTAGSSSAGSCVGGQQPAASLGTSLSLGLNQDHHCDPVLSSLMARALSAPSASSLKGAGKKFRSYRDHMRKVSALPGEQNNGATPAAAAATDLVDAGALFGFGSAAHHDREPFLGPNLYNQSLAAREQARSLLQSAAAMSSLSNLNQPKMATSGANLINQQTALRLAHQSGSHLNLPLSFAFDGSGHETNGRKQNFGWLSRGNQLNEQQSRNQHLNLVSQQEEEHYQLVNCSSASPSSSSSSAAAATGQTFVNLAESLQHNTDDKERDSSKRNGNQQGNHYSIIDSRDDDECRYEELDGNNELANEERATAESTMRRSQPNQYDGFRASSFLPVNNPYNSHNKHNSKRDNSACDSNVIDDFHLTASRQQPKPGPKANLRPSLTMSNSEHSNLANKTMAHPLNSEESSRQRADGLSARTGNKQRNNQHQDQLSPYAVSSICGSMIQPQQPPPPPPPPSTSEAIKALSEQFDFN